MASALVNLTYEVELKKGEVFSFPEEAAKQLKPGKWLISIRPAQKEMESRLPRRRHRAFLNSYADADEGLYDDYPKR
ncbi:hypothetical protein KJ068_02625 [bacterium]|nr:MAG: hypothetical protein EDS67_23105 [candidate division KSB1 bacterium]MCE7943966.1 hypothetical protein [Chlorobi bacterium CHB1]MCL4704025.1 hypothetical protein [bacterium]MDL1877364.1 hypothetical protein [Cytophagia bacterium CHB2]MBC6947473.1 hypothetical protein [candidate division KSB1 bacterium]